MYFFNQSDCLNFKNISKTEDVYNEEHIYFHYLNLELIY